MSRLVASLLKQFGPTAAGNSPPATPTLTLADNANDTGGVATITTATAGSTNYVYAARWSGGLLPAQFSLVGSRVSNGTLTLALAAGYWWCYCLSSLNGQSAISLVVGLRVTTGATALFNQCLDAFVAKIQALTLPSPWASSAVFKSKLPWERGFITASVNAAIWVTPLSDEFKQKLNQSDDWGLACQITAAQKSNLALQTGLPAHLLCRQQLVDCVLPKAGEAALAGVSEVMDVRIEPGPVLDPGAFQQNFDVSAFVARPITRRVRGLS